MGFIVLTLFIISLSVVSCKSGNEEKGEGEETKKDIKTNTVTVAAIQCPSRMGDIEFNRKLLASLIRKAAAEGAKIIVTPECSVTGYMDPVREIVWSRRPGPEGDEIDVRKSAETVPGPSTRFFSEYAKSLEIYLCIALVEREKDTFYNTQVLFDPKGRIVGHHRKKNLWPVGDSLWADQGDRPLQVVETPYGRIGLMICYDLHALPQELEKAGADIICYSIGWYGLETRNYFRNTFSVRYVKENGFSVIGANWASEKGSPDWSGTGASFVMSSDGTVKAMARTTQGCEIVIGQIKRTRKSERGTRRGAGKTGSPIRDK
ncbi:carbon-nitrogen hydrolase family protein [Planctomycetota bacterium]